MELQDEVQSQRRMYVSILVIMENIHVDLAVKDRQPHNLSMTHVWDPSWLENLCVDISHMRYCTCRLYLDMW